MSVATRQIPALSRRIGIASKGVRRSSGTTGSPLPVESPARPFIRRWIAAAMLLVAATLAVVYVSNAIAVNELLAEITSLERERDGVRSENERLRAELLRLMSVERVTAIATDELGMTQPAHPPVALPLRDGAAVEQEANDTE